MKYIALFFFVGCATPDFTTPLGIDVQTNGLSVDAEEIDATVRLVAGMLGKNYDATHLDIVFYKSVDKQCGDTPVPEGAERTGCTYPGYWTDTIKLRHDDCLSNTTLVHELIHWMKRDGAHPPELCACEESIEMAAGKIRCAIECPGTCDALHESIATLCSE